MTVLQNTSSTIVIFNVYLKCVFFFYSVNVFSSPELKAQVSFSNRLSSAVRLSVYFSHFNLHLQSQWANFNQTWHNNSEYFHH